MESEGEIVRQLIVFLEDRRALYEPYDCEVPHHVVDSVFQIRAELTETLRRLSGDSGAALSVRALRDACINFLRATGHSRGWGLDLTFAIALGQLRGVFAVYVGGLTDHYRIAIHGPLTSVVEAAQPVEDEEP